MRSLFEIACKRCNSNDGNSNCEAVLGELRATLLRRGGGVARVRPTHHARGRIRQNVDPFSQNSLFHRFSPNGSALWWPHHRKPRPRRRQSGGIAPSKAPTRRRHAARRLRMAQNPRHHRCRGCGRDWWAWLRCPRVVAGPGRAVHSDPAPLVWRAPEGPAAVPVGGGGAWPGFETTRRAKLAARTARGRAAAHGAARPAHSKGPEAPQRLGPLACQLLTG